MKLQLQTSLNMEKVSCPCNHEQLIYLIILDTHLTILILFLGPKSGLVTNNYLCLVSIGLFFSPDLEISNLFNIYSPLSCCQCT